MKILHSGFGPIYGLVVALCLLPFADLHAAPEAGSSVENQKGLSWQFQADTALPNVLLLGDSISIGYTLPVRALLKGKANVYRPLTADGKGPQNCAGTTAGLAGIDRWLGGHKWAVIHFNWGLHDLKHVTQPGDGKNSNQPSDPVQATVEQYAKNLEVLVGKLEATGARLIFATTTPVAPGTTNPLREPESPARYNAAALKIMQAHGIPVDDLYGFCEQKLNGLQLPKNVHFNSAGSQALARQVAAEIEAQLARTPTSANSSFVEHIISRMTTDEKLQFITGTNDFSIRGIPRLGWPDIVTANGPAGVRKGNSRGVRCAPSDISRGDAFPAPIGMAASWNRELLRSSGSALATECRARGVGVLLGPTVCIVRNPYGGRNFESYGEDPYLSGEMVVPFIQGLQAHGVVATVKHYAANNQEFDRFNIRENIDERALREIYLPAFEAAIRRGGSGSVMCAYPWINGAFCAENRWLLTDVLKQEWGFDGFVMTDWWATKQCDPVTMVHNGLDLEMPDGTQWQEATLRTALAQGKISLAEIDEKIRRILRTLHRIGADDHSKAPAFDEAQLRQATLQAARESIVLLKNNDGLLPLDPARTKSIAVVGPNAAVDQYGGGGSSRVNPGYTVSPLDGIRKLLGGNAAIRFARGCSGPDELRPMPACFLQRPDADSQGLEVSYYDNPDFNGTPVRKRIENQLGLAWKSTDVPTWLPGAFSARYQGRLRFDEAGQYKLIVQAAFGSATLFLDGKQVLSTGTSLATRDESDDLRPSAGSKKTKSTDKPKPSGEFVLSIDHPQQVDVRFDYVCPRPGAPLAFVQLIRPGDEAGLAEAVEAARRSDVAVVCAGLNSDLESEGHDLKAITLPPAQVELIRQVSQANPRTIVVLNNGTPLMISDWVGKIPVLVEAFYPGEEGGTALAEILFGKVNPSAKLPFSFYRKADDCLALQNYPADPGKKAEVTYHDGIFVGYRHLVSAGIEPLFAFGSGRSYTTFTYDKLKLSSTNLTGDDSLTLTFDVTNSGSREGAEVAQLYVHDLQASVPRPLRELKGFEKIQLQPGEKKTVSMVLQKPDLSFWSPKEHRWVAEDGAFQIQIGAASDDIRLKSKFNYHNSTDFAQSNKK